MRKWKSKRGLTLVELLVTVAVLGIVSGFSITIVVTAMNNYTEAAMLQKEQDTALMLEDYIVRNARVARKVEFVSDAPSVNYQGFYVAKIDNVVETFDYATIDPTTGNFDYSGVEAKKYTRFTYENVREITIDFSRQKRAVGDIESNCVYFMNYTITMMSGYQLTGQVVMNNADTGYLTDLAVQNAAPEKKELKGNSGEFVDSLAEYTLIKVTEGDSYIFEPNGNVALVFK